MVRDEREGSLLAAYKFHPAMSDFYRIEHELREVVHGGMEWKLIPYSDFNESNEQESLMAEALETFPVERLKGIMQKNLIARLPDTDLNVEHYVDQSRYTHETRALYLGMQMATDLGLPKNQVFKLGVGLLLHDIATPAMGDITKRLDPMRLDEENNWQKVLDKKGRAFLRRKGISIQEIDDMVHERGVLGQILKIADRLSYVTGDLVLLVGAPKDPATVSEYEKPFQEILWGDPEFGNIYKDVRLNAETSEVYFSNTERLANFLKLRALLWKNYYQTPIAMVREDKIVEILTPFYRSKPIPGALHPALLREMTDVDLYQFIMDRTGFNGALDDFADQTNRWTPEIITVDTPEEAEEIAQGLREREGIVNIRVKTLRKFDPGTDALVESNGQVIPFKKADPKTSAQLEEISRQTGKTYIYYDLTQAA